MWASCYNWISCTSRTLIPLQLQSDHVDQCAIFKKEPGKKEAGTVEDWGDATDRRWSPFLHYVSHNFTAVSLWLFACPLYVSECTFLCLSVRSLHPLLYPQLSEAGRSRKSSSVRLAEQVWRDAAPPVPGEPKLEMVALSEYSGMTSNWSPPSPSSTVSVSSSSSSLSSTWQGWHGVRKTGKCLREDYFIFYSAKNAAATCNYTVHLSDVK